MGSSTTARADKQEEGSGEQDGSKAVSEKGEQGWHGCIETTKAEGGGTGAGELHPRTREEAVHQEGMDMLQSLQYTQAGGHRWEMMSGSSAK